MSIAVDIEREDFTVDEIPHRVLERGMEIAQEYIKAYDRVDATEDDKRLLKNWRDAHRQFHDRFRRWNDLVASMGGERAALKLVIQARGFTPSTG